MIKLLKTAVVYNPVPIGKKDILIAGEEILRIADHIDGYDTLPDVEVYDLEGKTLVPGYIDLHVHITGGGGAQGPSSRAPASQRSGDLHNGTTPPVGGDLVLPSGLGGYYPSGLVIGPVEDVRTDDSGLTQYAVLQPKVEPAKLVEVFIITAFDIVD